MVSYRLKRIESAIAHALSEALARKVVRDPRVHHLVTISYAEISPDLRHGTIGISGYMSKTALRKTLVGLNNASGFLQTYLCNAIQIRAVPRLRFVIDTALAQGFDVIKKLEQLSPRTDINR